MKQKVLQHHSQALMAQMFYQKNQLASIDLTNLDTSNVTDMSFMFYECTGLTSLDLRSFDFRSLSIYGSRYYILSNIGNDSPNPTTITITNDRGFSTAYIGSGNYNIVYVD